MKNKQIFFILITVCILFIMPITVYAKGTHGGSGLEPLDPSIDGYNLDTLDVEMSVSKKDGDSFSDSIKVYGKAYLNTNTDNRGYVWVSTIRKYGIVRLLYATDEPMDLIDNGMMCSYVQGFGYPPNIEKPDFSLWDDSIWTFSPLDSPTDISISSGWGGDDVDYEFDIHVDSTLPVYCNTFEDFDAYGEWYNNGGYNLSEHPEQEYSKFGFTSDGNLSDGNIYDLEVPLELKSKGFDMASVGVINGLLALRPYFTWTQSDGIDVQDWYTESYVRIVGKNKKYPWNSWVDFDTGYVKDYGLFAEVPNYKRKISYKGDNWDTSCLKPPNEETRKGTSVIERYYVRTRNYWYDEKNKIMHYSNWVTWYIDKDGKMHCVENKDHDVTNTDEDGNVIIDSKNYNPTEDYEEKNKGKDTISSISLDSFLDSLKQAISTIGDIPNMLGAVFSWLPSIFISIVVTGIGLLILLRILGR